LLNEEKNVKNFKIDLHILPLMLMSLNQELARIEKS